MKWLVALEIENDPIATCRLMNIFRRKGVKIVTLAMAAGHPASSIMAVLETREAEMEHIFNFLRRTEGVQHVTSYGHQPGADTSFVYADAESSSVARFLEVFPDTKLIFGSHGKYLLEVPAESQTASAALGFDEPEFLPLARVRTTRSAGIMNDECGMMNETSRAAVTNYS